jgi:hypothetical protein
VVYDALILSANAASMTRHGLQLERLAADAVR